MKKMIGYAMGMVTLLAGTPQNTGAATLSEMRRLNASQQPGMMVVCTRTTDIPQKDEAPVRIESFLKGVVLQNDGDRMVFDVTYTQHYAKQPGPFRTEKYQLTTELEATRQKMVIDPDTIELSLPYARDREAYFLGLLKAHAVSYDEYRTYQVSSATEYQILPDPGSTDTAVMNCSVHSAPGNSSQAGQDTKSPDND